MIEKRIANNIIAVLLPYLPSKIGIFGSYARNENKEGSDLDILISLRKPISLLKLVQLQQTLTDDLGIPVDLVTENSLKNPRLKQFIYNDLVTIYNEEE
ncbi:hypothetical protein C7N43_30060 [Sphingobacteriales bacterium UPWRP_1]|nr:hypothetical protein B6N25_17110 [Sphingobacteriales bacterium TSM_CSS]PSJ73252.1 hypothetical protein C7N43_30060 [Sphingobacteriales bacterium UPWRP_1]